jgi:hypothetical protein
LTIILTSQVFHVHRAPYHVRITDGCCPRIEDETWQNAEDTWKQLPSSKVASAYVQAYRIADKVIQAKGNNKLLVSGGKHPSHFKFTENGGERIDKRRTSARNN